VPTRLNCSEISYKSWYFKHLLTWSQDKGSARINRTDPFASDGSRLYGATRITVAATVSVTIAVVTASAANGVITNSRSYHGVIS
jgi:hypothetical protein